MKLGKWITLLQHTHFTWDRLNLVLLARLIIGFSTVWLEVVLVHLNRLLEDVLNLEVDVLHLVKGIALGCLKVGLGWWPITHSILYLSLLLNLVWLALSLRDIVAFLLCSYTWIVNVDLIQVESAIELKWSSDIFISLVIATDHGMFLYSNSPAASHAGFHLLFLDPLRLRSALRLTLFEVFEEWLTL